MCEVISVNGLTSSLFEDDSPGHSSAVDHFDDATERFEPSKVIFEPQEGKASKAFATRTGEYLLAKALGFEPPGNSGIGKIPTKKGPPPGMTMGIASNQSGRQDSNLRPLDPQGGIRTPDKARETPIFADSNAISPRLQDTTDYHAFLPRFARVRGSVVVERW
ncbi:MAG: hypothetical protein WED34_05475 [Planctomycetales bacterium]